MQHSYDFEPKKKPKQKRSIAAVNAIVEACEILLPLHGYKGTTTNRIAATAGVSVASVYEYFPGKDAIILKVGERVSERILAGGMNLLPKLQTLPVQDYASVCVKHFTEVILSEREMISIFMFEIPYSNYLAKKFQVTEKLVDLIEKLLALNGKDLSEKHSRSSLYHLSNMITTSIFQMATNPAQGISEQEMIESLSKVINRWFDLN